MLSIMDDGVEIEVEWKFACAFNAEIHAEHFRTVLLEMFDIDVEKWTIRCIADNTSTNQKIARLLGLTSYWLFEPSVKFGC